MNEEITTSNQGRYEAELTLPPGSLSGAKLQVQAKRTAYRTSDLVDLPRVVKQKTDGKGNTCYLVHHSFTLMRAVTPGFWIAAIVLTGVYVLIAFEMMHRTLAALLGAAVILTVSYTAGSFNPEYVILSFEDAMHVIGMNVIFVLMAMMIIVGILKKTGIFQWMAYKSYQLARGNVFALSLILMAVVKLQAELEFSFVCVNY